MEKYLMVIESNCADSEREQEFNDWYNNVHIPDLLQTEGFIKAERYELLKPVEGKGRYLAIYEIETDDFEATQAKLRKTVETINAQKRMTNLIKTTSRGSYKRINSFTKKKKV